MSKKVLWLIVARSGSKSIPNKNIALLGGHPLLSYRIHTAKNTTCNNEIWISTDSIEYADIAIKYGAKAPFLRPKELADDFSNSADVVHHAMEFAQKNCFTFDFIGLLEPTSPFITKVQIEQAIQNLINEPEADSIVAVRESRPNTLFIQDEKKYLDQIAKEIENIKLIGRQNFSKQITPSGGFYISRWDSFFEQRSFYTCKTLGFLVDNIAGLEIDEPIDFSFANFLIETNIINIDVKF
jgi:N-acylneuraminate cytidylyltransferase/CMP-N,N'-diacetyllegionaminic acid synthase